VGNISHLVTDEDLNTAFAAFGEVKKAWVVVDDYLEESMGYGFVDMPDEDCANKAIDAMNLKLFKGRKLKVNKFRPKKAPKESWVNRGFQP
jgi:RNA recognition motif-containing protein